MVLKSVYKSMENILFVSVHIHKVLFIFVKSYEIEFRRAVKYTYDEILLLLPALLRSELRGL